MSYAAVAAWAAAAIAGAGVAITSENSRKASSMHEDAQKQSVVQAQQQATQVDQANNNANKKQPNVSGILSAAQQAAKGGVGGTMLTGPQGVDPSTLTLGKSTLLGG